MRSAVRTTGGLSVPDVAERLGVSVSTVWRMLRRGELPSVRRAGRRLVPAKALERRRAQRTRREIPPLTENHPIWRLVGAYRSGGDGPGSGDKHAILDE